MNGKILDVSSTKLTITYTFLNIHIHKITVRARWPRYYVTVDVTGIYFDYHHDTAANVYYLFNFMSSLDGIHSCLSIQLQTANRLNSKQEKSAQNSRANSLLQRVHVLRH
jgi:hypothetical protein